jgi:hypothetical protein
MSPESECPPAFGKLVTNIIHSDCPYPTESAVTDSLPEGEFVHGHFNLLPNHLARQKYRHTSVPFCCPANLNK